MSQEPASISAPVLPEGSKEPRSALFGCGIIAAVILGAFVVVIVIIPLQWARTKEAQLLRSHGLATIGDALTLYEQTHHVRIADLPDWKKALVDSGYITEDVFESRTCKTCRRKNS